MPSSAMTDIPAAILARVPPNDEDAEMALLGSLLLDGEVVGAVAPLVRPDDFYKTAHRRVYEVVLSLSESRRGVDALLVLKECERLGLLADIGGREFLASLATVVPTAANAEHYARVIRDKSVARGLIRVATDIQREAYERGGGDDLLETAEHAIFELARTQEMGQASSVRTLLEETFRDLDARDGTPSGVPTGFHLLDDLTAGLHAGELIIVAGRPSMGKTTFALNVAVNVALRRTPDQPRTNVAIFSLEMSRQQITKNILCSLAEVEAHKLRGGRFLDDAEFKRLQDAAAPLYEAGLFIDDTPGLSTTALRAKARRLKQKHDIGMIVIDYMQLMEAIGTSRNVDSRQQEISYISRSLKGLARELSIPVIALSQLNRAADAREDHKPRMSDLRESGSIEQDADVICFLYRKHYYTKAESDRGLAEVIVAKQRNGPTDTVRVAFLDQYMRFDNLSLSTPTG